MRQLLIRCAGCAAGAFVTFAGNAQGQVLRPLGFIDSNWGGPSIANGISGDGRVVVGVSGTPDGDRAFRWTAQGGMQNLGAFANPGDYTSSEAFAANFDGSVITGTSIRPDSLNEDGSAFRWTAAAGLQFIGSVGGSTGGSGYAITPDGSVIVGSTCAPDFNYVAFRRTSGSPVALASVTGQDWAGANCVSPDGQLMGGWARVAGQRTKGAFFFAGGAQVQVLPELAPSVFGSFVSAMTPSGNLLVGTSALRAVTWTDGLVHDLGSIPGGEPQSYYFGSGVSEDGNTIVGMGNYDPESTAGSAFIWDPVHGMRDLNLVADAAGVDRHGFWMVDATGVSADGLAIVGYGFSATDQEAFLLDLHTGNQCYANCDGSNTPPIVNAGDFTCFLQKYAAGQQLPPAQQLTHYANCDGSTIAPVLNVGDFTCFLQRFAAGCP